MTKILVAEDDPVSQKILERYLHKWNYDVTVTADGESAWTALSSGAFHLAILDWNMPGLSGIQLCERIRADESLALLYLILLTGRTERADIKLGFEAGADDYVVKPYDPVELYSRLKVACRLVESGLLLRQQNLELNRYAKEMEGLAEERSRMLIHAERLATLGTLTAGVAHEVNNPNTFISGNAQTLQRCWPRIKRCLEQELVAHPEDKKLAMMLEEVPKMLDGIRTGVSRITTIVNGLKRYAGVGKNTLEPCDINRCIENALLLCTTHLKRKVQVIKALMADPPSLMGDSQQLEQVFVNLFTNAADAFDELPKDTAHYLRIQTLVEGSRILVNIEDNGPGIPEQVLESIWKPFFTTKKAGKGTGLGLAISQGIINDHSGTITVANLPEAGVRFTIALPSSP